MQNHAMIAFLPEDGSWCKQDFPHMTLVYAGVIDDRPLSDFNVMAKDAVSVATFTGPFSLQVTGLEVFGPPEDRVDVLTLYPTPQLLIARKMVEKWNGSEFKDYKPHATIGPEGSASSDMETRPDGHRRRGLPTRLYFNQIVAAWGDRKLIFNLGEIF
jgi:2'-5' RNA ligase